MRQKILWLSVVVIVVAVGAAAWFTPWKDKSTKPGDDNPEIHQFTLSNGMPVILVPNHRVPAISHTLWLTIGAADDPRGKSGLAHYLEHLMFKGTPNVPTGEFSRIVEQLGGHHNAFTSRDFTGYYVNIAKEHLETVMKLEADRFQHLSIPQNEYEKEREVIIEERRTRIENNPSAILDEQIDATLYLAHPYRIPVIGWKHEMEALTLEDANNFYRYYYHPGNMVLVVAGDITQAELQPLAEQYYGGIAARKPAAHNWLQEPPHQAERLVTLRHAQVQQPKWTRSYLAPSLVAGNTGDVIPLNVFSYWLGNGKTSELYQTLVVKKKLAISVNSGYSGLAHGPATFSINVVPNDGVDLETIGQAVDEVIERMKTTQMDAETLARAKTLLKAEVVYARDGLEPVAQYVGYLKAIGADLSYFTRWTEYVDAVTAEQVQIAAQNLLLPEQSVTGYLLPKPVAPKAPDAETPPAAKEKKHEE